MSQSLQGGEVAALCRSSINKIDGQLIHLLTVVRRIHIG
jgi:hypothetical protein